MMQATREEERMSDRIVLDRDAVERFLATVRDLRPLIARLERDPAHGTLADSLARDERARAVVARFLAERGYASIEAWEATVRTVTAAYGTADPQSGLAVLPETLRSVRESIQNDAGLSADEKLESIAEIDAELAEAERMRPSEADVAAVTPFMARLRAVLRPD
jgi:hypothetical protein